MKPFFKKSYNYWKANLLAVSFSALALVFMEWVFITTKPSFLSGTPIQEKISVLIMSTTLVIGMLLILSFPFLICCSIFPGNVKFNAHLLSIFPAITLASLTLLLIDNFTYTLFKFGIVNTSGVSRAAYLILWCTILIVIFLRLERIIEDKILRPVVSGIFTLLLPALIIVFSTIIAILFVQYPKIFVANNMSNILTDRYPNILLFTADGVNAENMSLYGYERETTPFLDSIKDKLIISQNHFTNSANTSGSIVSILTGKTPTTTRLLYPPDVLKGKDSIEHLPGILRNIGYYTAQFAVNHYIDSSTQNLQDSFDESNGNKLQTSFTTKFLSNRFPSNSKLFLKESEERLISRLKHIFFIESMENTFLQITETQKDFKDKEKVIKTLDLIKSKNEPVFIHIHWMGTHGSKFFPNSNKYSSDIDRENQPLWDADLYDDAIIDVDAALMSLFEGLSEIGELENTIVIFTSDHGQKFSVINRLPMLIYFPDVEDQIVSLNNTQNIDIAPTILDLIDVERPGWMSEGQSMIGNDQSSDLIFATGTLRSEHESSGNVLDEEYLIPPFYQFDFINVIDCDRYYSLNLEELSWSNGIVASYVGACSEKDYASGGELRTLILNRLTDDGFEFDQSTVPEIP